MKSLSAPDTQTSSRAAAHTAPANGIAMPAVHSELEQQQEQPQPVNETTAQEVPLTLDMNDDGEDEPHILFINPDDGELWLHSDKETLSTFLGRKYGAKHREHLSEAAKDLLALIEADAKIVHEGTYSQLVILVTPRLSSKGLKTQDRKAPNVHQRAAAREALKRIAVNLQKLHLASNKLMKKSRPPSVRKEWSTHDIDGTRYCKKIVMEPLSILPREDGITGSPPENDGSAFFTKLTQLTNYKRGHMLNEHLHGPGTADNLVPISTAFNNIMKTTIEKDTKDAVNANNKVVRFEAEPRGWGNYKGAFDSPDERKLPNKFWFHVQPMEQQLGTDGSKKEDWIVSRKPAIFKEEMVHTSPADIKRGAIAPEKKTFNEGYYFSGNGDFKAESATVYLLSGTFYENKASFNYLFKPLGLDPAGTYNELQHDLKATTRFELPPGLELIKDTLEKSVEFVWNNNIIKTNITDISFIVVKKDSRKAHQDAYKAQLENLRQQLALDKAAAEEEAKKARIQQTSAASNAPTDRTAPLRAHIQQQYEIERQRYKNDFIEGFQLQFEQESQELLNQAMKTWTTGGALTANNMKSETDALIDELRKLKGRLHEQQVNRTGFVKTVLEELSSKINTEYGTHVPRGPQKAEFVKAAERICNNHKIYWRRPENSYIINKEKMITSALAQVKVEYERIMNATSPPATSSPKRKLESESESESEKMITDNDKGKEKENDQKGSAAKKNKTSHNPD
jgi:hypothetical protein